MIDHAVESQASLLDSPRSTLKETGHGDMENAARFPHLPPTATTNYCVQMTRKISSSGCPRLAIPSSPLLFQRTTTGNDLSTSNWLSSRVLGQEDTVHTQSNPRVELSLI